MEKTIWSSYDAFDLMDDEEFINEYLSINDMDETYDDLPKYKAYDIAWEYNEGCLDDARANLNIDVHSPILAIADLGLWDGRVTGYKEMKTSNISDCLYSDCEYAEWYCDEHDFKLKESHHDGTNYITYRMRKENISDDQWDNFLWKIYENKATNKDITRYTKSLMPYIARVYG